MQENFRIQFWLRIPSLKFCGDILYQNQECSNSSSKDLLPELTTQTGEIAYKLNKGTNLHYIFVPVSLFFFSKSWWHIQRLKSTGLGTLTTALRNTAGRCVKNFWTYSTDKWKVALIFKINENNQYHLNICTRFTS